MMPTFMWNWRFSLQCSIPSTFSTWEPWLIFNFSKWHRSIICENNNFKSLLITLLLVMNVKDTCKALGLHHKGIRLVLPGSTDSTSPLLVGLLPLSLKELHRMDYSEEKIIQVYPYHTNSRKCSWHFPCLKIQWNVIVNPQLLRKEMSHTMGSERHAMRRKGRNMLSTDSRARLFFVKSGVL